MLQRYWLRLKPWKISHVLGQHGHVWSGAGCGEVVNNSASGHCFAEMAAMTVVFQTRPEIVGYNAMCSIYLLVAFTANCPILRYQA